MKYLLILLYKLIRQSVIIVTALVALLVVYPLAVLVPFLWNFKVNKNGLVLNEFKFTDDSEIFVFLLGYFGENRYRFLYETYKTYFHFLYAVYFDDTSKDLKTQDSYSIYNSTIEFENGN